MGTIKQLFVDSLNGLSVDMIPLFIFQLLSAGLLGLLLQKIVNRKFNAGVEQGALIAIAMALIASIAKYSVSFSILFLGVILILGRNKELNSSQALGMFLIALTGVACGVGSVIQAIIGFVFLTLVILFVPIKK